MRFLFIAMLLVTSAVNATTVTIDFENVSSGDLTPLYLPGPGDDGSKTFQTDGFTFNLNGGLTETPENNYVYGSKIQQLFTPDAYVDMRRTDGQAFSLHDVDIFACEPNCLIWGAISIGGVVSTFSTDNTADLGSGDWLNVTYVSFGNELEFGPSVAVDNIVVGAAVPIPAAVWLFGSALAGLGWMRRKQTV
jgi:hypothetical protein